MKILFYAVNGIGIGHVVRCATIASEIKKSSKHEILFLTNSAFVEFLEENKIPYIKIPHDLREYPSGRNTIIDNTALFNSIINEYLPDIVVYDCHFERSFLESVKRIGGKNVLMFRMVKEEKFAQYLKKEDMILFDKKILVHDINEINFYGTQIYDFFMENNFDFLGPVIRNLPDPCTDSKKNELFNKHGLSQDMINVVVSGGGGGHPEIKDFFAMVKQAFSNMEGFNVVYINGPLNIRPVYTKNLIELMTIADFVICQAGYNTINEIIYYKIPAIVIPGYRDSEYQEVRARFWEQKSALRVVLDDEDLKNTILNFSRTDYLNKIKNSLSELHIDIGNQRISTTILLTIEDKEEKIFFRIENELDSELKQQIKKMREENIFIIANVIYSGVMKGKLREIVESLIELEVLQIQISCIKLPETNSEILNTLELRLLPENYHFLIYHSENEALSRTLVSAEKRKKLIFFQEQKLDALRARQKNMFSPGELMKFIELKKQEELVKKQRSVLWLELEKISEQERELKGKQIELLKQKSLLEKWNQLELEDHKDEKLKKLLVDNFVFPDWLSLQNQILLLTNPQLKLEINLIEQKLNLNFLEQRKIIEPYKLEWGILEQQKYKIKENLLKI